MLLDAGADEAELARELAEVEVGLSAAICAAIRPSRRIYSFAGR